MYYFDKTAVNEANFVSMTQTDSFKYTATVPAGYTHIIFIDYDENGSVGSWENILNQTADLIIPTDSMNIYSTVTNSWTSSATE